MERPSGTVTFLLTDIEGSTRRWEANPKAMRSALTVHDKVLRSAIEAHGGWLFKHTGDGVAAAFSSARAAIDAAIAAQRQLELPVRMGIATGEAREHEGDYFGPVLNRTARVMEAAYGGQVLVAGSTAMVVSGVELLDLGEHRLRDLAGFERLLQVCSDGLRSEFPAPRTVEAIEGNLGVPITSFVGREREVKELYELVQTHRLVTLAGAGGVGKTRLALEVGALAADDYPDGVWLVELAPLADSEDVASTIASTLGVRPREGMSLVSSIVTTLRGRRLLLIVDNCEHVIDAVAAVVEVLVTSSSAIAVLATTREPLAIAGERVFRVPSLPVDDAVELFYERASAADESLAFAPGDRGVVSQICQRLDGIPLAIELAAARTRSLTPAELLTRLNDSFALLRRSARGVLRRHQTLRTTVDWSYQLLTEDERLVFDRASVFAGGFDLEAADAICDQGVDTLDLLTVLIDKSMITADKGEGRTRYRTLETLRQFGEERLVHRGELTMCRERHLRHFVGVAVQADRLFQSAREVEGVAVIDREWDNFRAAHNWAITTDLTASDALLWSLTLYAGFRGRAELGEWVERAIAATDGRPPSAAAAGIAGHWAYVAGDTERAVQLARAGIGLAPAPDHPRTAWCWHVLTSTSDGRENPARFQEAALCYERAARAADAPLGVVMALVRQVQCAAVADHASVPALLRRLEEFANSVGSPTAQVSAISARARSHLALGNPQEALDGFRSCRELAHKHGIEDYEASASVGAAVARSIMDDPDADAAFVDAIVTTRAEQNWGHLWRALSSAAAHFERRGRKRPAAMLRAYLVQAHRWMLFPGDRGMETLEVADRGSDALVTSSVEEIVTRTLEALGA